MGDSLIGRFCENQPKNDITCVGKDLPSHLMLGIQMGIKTIQPVCDLLTNIADQTARMRWLILP